MTDKDYEEEDLEEAEDDDTLEDEVDDVDEDEEEEEVEEDVVDKVEEKPKQSPQQNEFYKNLRLKEKEESKIREDERRKTLLDSVNRTNPYTNKPIIDEEDEEEYFTMREIESRGLNPVEDYSSFIKTKRREEKKAQPKQFDTEADYKEFKNAYPEVNVKELMNDNQFLDLFGEELGKVSLKTLYKAYEKTNDRVKEVKKKNLKEKRDKNNVGSVASTTKTSYKDISTMDYNSKEFEDLLLKARRGELKSE